MSRFLRLTLLAFGLLSCGLLQTPADAAGAVMCRGAAAAAAPGPARWVAAASGTAYTLDTMGCALIAQTDLGDAGASGLTQSAPLRSLIFTTGVMTSTTSVQVTPNLPAGAYIRDIFIDNTTANAVSGGIDIGKTSGAADIVSAKTCAANCLSFVADSALLLRVFSKTVQQAIWVTGHTDAASANLTLTITYGYF